MFEKPNKTAGFNLEEQQLVHPKSGHVKKITLPKTGTANESHLRYPGKSKISQAGNFLKKIFSPNHRNELKVFRSGELTAEASSRS